MTILTSLSSIHPENIGTIIPDTVPHEFVSDIRVAAKRLAISMCACWNPENTAAKNVFPVIIKHTAITWLVVKGTAIQHRAGTVAAITVLSLRTVVRGNFPVDIR